MFELIIATSNKDKFEEIRDILKGLKIRLYSLSDFKKVPRIKEDGSSFLENAAKKAVVVSRFLKGYAVADDSGLEVDFLDGRPGIYSARFAGKQADYSANNRKLLKLLKGVPFSKRKAKFICCVCFAYKGRVLSHFYGYLKGYIIEQEKGRNGFGYDPLFYLPAYKKTLAQMPARLKNSLSHRYKAFVKFKRYLQAFLKKNKVSI